jgi:ABC-type multidrug transport system fused ATPase/permease subunit
MRLDVVRADASLQVNSAIDAIIREQNITVILAAHRLSSIARAERVIVLENGKVSEEGRYDVLVSGRTLRDLGLGLA